MKKLSALPVEIVSKADGRVVHRMALADPRVLFIKAFAEINTDKFARVPKQRRKVVKR